MKCINIQRGTARQLKQLVGLRRSSSNRWLATVPLAFFLVCSYLAGIQCCGWLLCWVQLKVASQNIVTANIVK
jgi:hypothetical protein